MRALRPVSLPLLLLIAACGGSTTEQPRDRVPRQRTADGYIAMLEGQDRASWQMPERLVEALRIEEGMRVADVGTGSGYFLPLLNGAVGPTGVVVAEDIDAELLGRLRTRVTHDGLSSVEVRLGAPDDAHLEPGTYDRVLMVDTMHHVVDRVALMRHIARALGPDGRFFVVDFAPGDHVPEAVSGHEHRIDPALVLRDAATVGLVLVQQHDFLPYQFVLELGAAPPDAGDLPP